MDKNGNTSFERYYKRLAHEGWLKSLLIGLIVGFAINVVVAIVTWCVNFNGLWLSIGTGLAAAIVMTLALYFLRFRPTSKQIAERVDRLGLEERLITMLELENDESYIALRQREDARARMSETDSKRIRFQISTAALVAVCVLFAGNVAMTTVSALSAEGIVPTPPDIIDQIFPEPIVSFSVSYVVEEVEQEDGFIEIGGYIEGEAEQVVDQGLDAEPVLAVAEDGYMFVGWSDGLTDPYRQDLAIEADLEVTAMFEAIGEGDQDGDSDQDGESQDGEEGDEAQDQPSDSEEQGNPSEDQDSKSDSESDPSQSQNAGGGRYEEHNQIIDGETYYRDALDGEYYERMLELLEEGNLPPELRDFIESYFDIIH